MIQSSAPACALALAALVSAAPAQDRPGYTDTPTIPGSEWKVHDSARPYPAVVDPGTSGDPAPAPKDATVLLGQGADGLAAWVGRNKETAQWKLVPSTGAARGYMEVNGTGDISTVDSFGSCQLHVEWASPIDVKGAGQGRGNSGVFFMGRYEVQVLDSYDNPTYADGQAAALYGQYPPMVNACRKPGEWQSYDIVFDAPVFEGERLLEPARVTVFHNGVLVHHARPLLGGTAHKSLPSYSPHGDGPIKLQDHGNPVRFRNIWVRPLDTGAAGAVADSPAAPSADSLAGNYYPDVEDLKARLAKDFDEVEATAMLDEISSMDISMTIKDDQTFHSDMLQGGTEASVSGTWKIEGDSVAMTATERNGEAMPGNTKTFELDKSGALLVDGPAGVKIRFVKKGS